LAGTLLQSRATFEPNTFGKKLSGASYGDVKLDTEEGRLLLMKLGAILGHRIGVQIGVGRW
jgi:hypothetical protein